MAREDEIEVRFFISLDIDKAIYEYTKEIGQETGIALTRTGALKSIIKRFLLERKKTNED